MAAAIFSDLTLGAAIAYEPTARDERFRALAERSIAEGWTHKRNDSEFSAWRTREHDLRAEREQLAALGRE